MGLIDNLIKKFFGSKSDRDIKEIQPIVDLVIEEYAKLGNLSNDQLRELSFNLKAKIRACAEKENQEIENLKAKIEDPELDIKDKEKYYEQIEKLNVVVDTKIKEALDESLPLAFAIIKDTARRFTENDKLEVTATDFDRELAATRNSITIEGNKAFYSKRWLAG